MITVRFNIPDNFNADTFVPKARKDKQQNIADGMHYILHLLHPNFLEKKKQECLETFGFIPLHAALLKKIIGNNYKQILQLLIRERVVISNNSYIIGSISMGYRLNSMYMRPTRPIEIKSAGIKERYLRHLKEQEHKQKRRLQKVKHLQMWFD